MSRDTSTLRRAKKQWRMLIVQRVAWILLGLLGISAVLISLGQQETATLPSPSNFGPAGAAAFAELLKSAGYTVEDSTSTMPDLRHCDLAIAFTVDETLNPFAAEREDSQREEAKKTLNLYAKDGGQVMYLPLPADFKSQSKAVSDTKFSGLLGPMPTGTVTFRKELVDPIDQYGHHNSTLYESVGEPLQETYELGVIANDVTLGTLAKKGTGHILGMTDGIIATNRLIDRADNATLLMRMVGMLAKPGAHIVFTEASWGHASSPSIMEAIGPWAIAGWQQMIFLGVVVAYSLGKRFGIGQVYFATQQGSREFVDAMANLYQRAHSGERSIDVSVRRAERLLKRRLKLAPELANADLRKFLPPSLNDALYSWKIQGLESNPLFAIKRIDRELTAFLNTLK